MIAFAEIWIFLASGVSFHKLPVFCLFCLFFCQHTYINIPIWSVTVPRALGRDFSWGASLGAWASLFEPDHRYRHGIDST